MVILTKLLNSFVRRDLLLLRRKQEELPLKEGDCFRIAPQGERCLRAADDSAMRFVCIQAKAGSLEGFTMSDAVVTESGSKPSWL